jgi:hypothetical protein
MRLPTRTRWSGFFYIRQIATTLAAVGSQSSPCVSTIGVSRFSRFGKELAAELGRRVVPGVRVRAAAAEEDSATEGIVLSDLNAEAEQPGTMPVQLRFLNGATRLPERAIYNPLFRAGSPLFELAVRSKPDPETSAFARYLSKAGFIVTLSRRQNGFGLDDMIAAYLHPIADYVLAGGSPASRSDALGRAEGWAAGDSGQRWTRLNLSRWSRITIESTSMLSFRQRLDPASLGIMRFQGGFTTRNEY